MWTFFRPLSHHVWTTRLRCPTPCSQFASYHVTPACLRSERSSSNPVVRRQHRPAGLETNRKHDYDRVGQSKVWKNEIAGLQKKNRKGEDHRVSSELRKLSLEDFPVERERPRGQRSAPESKAETYEIVFGVAPCLLALIQGRRKARKLFVKDGEASHRASVLKVCEAAHRQGVQVQRVDKKDLDKMSSGRVHQGVCLQASPLVYLTESRDPIPKRTDPHLWLVLERIQDPMNLGAILRSAYFLGVDRVASSLRHSCPLSPIVSKASSGVMEVMGVYGYENLVHMLEVKVAQGWHLVGTVGAEAEANHIPVTKCSDFQMTKPTLLLIGGEGEGLSQELLSLCQTLLTIPAGRELIPSIESLNVSVATGILLHSLLSAR